MRGAEGVLLSSSLSSLRPISVPLDVRDVGVGSRSSSCRRHAVVGRTERDPLDVLGVEGNAAVVAHDVRQLLAEVLKLDDSIRCGVVRQHEVIFFVGRVGMVILCIIIRPV